MLEPYMRIFVQPFTVILGTFILIFNAGKIFILIFAVVKIFFTVIVNYEDTLNKLGRNRSIYQESNNSHS